MGFFRFLRGKSVSRKSVAPGIVCRRSTQAPGVEVLEDRTVPSTLIPISNSRDFVYDAARNMLDVTTANGALQMYNITVQTLQQPLSIGYNLAGADIAADGNTLVVADRGITGRQVLHVFNLQTFSEHDLSFPNYQNSSSTFDIALTNSSRGMFDETSSLNSVHVEMFDFNSGTYTWRQDAIGSKGRGLIGPNTLIQRSADRSLMFFADTGSSLGNVFTYNTATDTFSNSVSLGFPLTGAVTAVNHNGTLMAVQVNGATYILNQHLNLINRLPGLDAGVTFDPAQDIMYAVSSSTDQIYTINTNTWATIGQMPVGEAVPRSAPLGYGRMLATPNSWLFLATPSGVREYQLQSASSFAISTPATSQAGAPVSFTVTAVGANGYPFNNYTGTIHITSSDPRTGPIPDYTFQASEGGSHTFQLPLYTAGPQTFTVTDSVNANANRTSAPIQVTPGPTAFFGSTYYGNSSYGEAAGYSFPLYLEAEDLYNNITPNYTGTVHFTSSDAAAQLPADYTFTATDGGVHKFTPTLNTAGYQSITVTDNSPRPLSITMNNIQVSDVIPGLHFVVTPATTNPVAGVAFGFTVTALDYLNQVATHYLGTVAFSGVGTSGGGASPGNGGGAVLPGNYTFTAADAGAHTFSVILTTAGSQTVAVLDASWVTGNGVVTANFTVSPAAASVFRVIGFPGSVSAGTSDTFVVTAYDPYGNVATGYAGTVHFTSSDPNATLPVDGALTNGRGSFTATLTTAGTESLTATDSANAALTGSEAGIAVSPAAATSLVLTAFPASVTAGTSAGFAVTAYDPYGNVATGYNGTVHFTSSDPNATLPADATLVNGTGTFTAMLTTAGLQSLTVTDTANANLTSTESGISVNPSAAASLVLAAPSTVTAGTAFAFTVTAYDAYGNVATGYLGTVQFASTDGLALLPAAYTFAAADAGSATFTATLATTGDQTLSVSDALSNLSGSLGVLVVSA
jgi:hypothetical protein